MDHCMAVVELVLSESGQHNDVGLDQLGCQQEQIQEEDREEVQQQHIPVEQGIDLVEVKLVGSKAVEQEELDNHR